MNEVVKITSELIRLKSLSGNESSVADYICQLLNEWGFEYSLIPVGSKRNNIFAHCGQPKVILSTHMDIVPAPDELFVPRLEADRLIGRGACDAKGILAAMLCAGKALKKSGLSGFGFLFVVGEEWGGDGAKIAAQSLAKSGIKWVINGEPTEGLLMRGHKGTLDCKVSTTGRPCHSGYPQLGESAINKLVGVLSDILSTNFGFDSVLGENTLNIGQISGGVALNVLAPKAEAGLLFRLATPHQEVLETLKSVVAGRAELSDIDFTEPVQLTALDGYPSGVAAYATDIPNLAGLGSKFLLFGPGSIQNAHTNHEFVLLSELIQAIDSYQTLVKRLIDMPDLLT